MHSTYTSAPHLQACAGMRRGAALVAVSLLLVTMALCSHPQTAWAVTSEERQAEADAIFAQIDELQTQLNGAYAEYDEASAAYEEANAEHEQANADYDAAIAKMEEAQATIKRQTARIESLQDELAACMVNMYKYNDSDTFLNVVMGSQSFDEFLTAWDAMEAISGEGAKLVGQTKDARAKTEAARAEYEEQGKVAEESMQRAEESMQRAEESMATAQAKAAEIETTQADLRTEADKITAEVAELQAQEEAAAEAAKAAEEAAAAAARSDAASSTGYVPQEAGAAQVSGTGAFSHPLPSGSISSTFGYRDFDSSFHMGLDLAAPEGTPYYAADSGTVIYATNDGSYNGGAGNWIVIAHGNGLVTKYMHSSAVYVNVGDAVTRGQNIGAVGNTGNSFGAHLHFQVELNGSAVDPLGYL
jgi:murein DD-endopeptidase MepM/ murein hydrolase activator NlpD